jgi:hypothetical protein
VPAREQRREKVTGSDAITRTRAETGHTRPLTTVFGQVTATRIAYRAPGAVNVHPVDAALNLPEEKHSHGLRQHAAADSARGSFGDAVAAITRATGVVMGKRQVEELARRAAADVDAFYAIRRPGPAPDDQVLVLTFDGKGIVMRPEALRPATAKAAASTRRKLATRLSPGEKHGRKRMAELAAVYDAIPVARTPADIITPPGHHRPARKRGPAASGKWLTASVTEDITTVVAAGFDEAERRDPGHRRTWVALADGNRDQIDAITAEATRRGATITVVCDFVHVLEYTWKAARSFFDKGDPDAEEWVAAQAAKILQGRPGRGRNPPPRHHLRLLRHRTRGRRLLRRLPHRQGTVPGLRHRPRRRLADRHRSNRRSVPSPGQRPNGPYRGQVGPGRRRGRPQAPRPHRQRRLRPVLALPPAPGTQAHPQR